jgi:hypothetical protein
LRELLIGLGARAAKEVDLPTGIELGVRRGGNARDVVEILATTRCGT